MKVYRSNQNLEESVTVRDYVEKHEETVILEKRQRDR